MDETQLIEGGRKMIPVLRALVELAEQGDSEATLRYQSKVVGPTYRAVFNDARFVDVRDSACDSIASLPLLASLVTNGAVNRFTGVENDEDRAVIEELADGARPYLARMEKIVGQSLETDLAA